MNIFLHTIHPLLHWRHFQLLLTGLAVTLLMAALYVFQPGILRFMEHKVYDTMFQSLQSNPTGTVAIVDLDDQSLKEFGQWPWPRYRVAMLAERIRRAGAASIALDIVFAEEDRTSPDVVRHSLRSELGVDIGFTGLPTGLENNDSVLAGILKQGPYVLGYYFRVEELESDDGQPSSPAHASPEHAPDVAPPPLKLSVLKAPDAMDVKEALFLAGGVVGNIPVLAGAAQAAGFINVGADGDGIVRKAPLIISWEDGVYASLALAAVLRASGSETGLLRLTSGGVESLRLAGRNIPLDARGRMLLNYRGGRRTIPTYSARDVLEERLQPGALDGKIVFIGTSAAGLMDIRSTPLDRFYPGVEAQATVADNIVGGDFLRRPDWAPGLELTLIVGMGLLSTLLLLRMGGIWPLIILAVLGSSAWFGAVRSLNVHGLYLSPLMPMLTLAGNFGILSFLKFWSEEKEKRKIRNSFEHYLSPEVITRVLKNPDMLKLGGEKKELTVLFSDIRNFTSLSEKLEPQELVAFMNEFHSAMTGIILEQGGTLDKYIGDAVMAFFGAPEEQPDHALIGCRTALAMMERLYECRKDWCFPGFSRIEIGVGISSGEMVVGNMGSVKRMSYTVMGDQVNLASRLEGLTKQYGVKILISQFTFHQVRHEITCREIDQVRVKGKDTPVSIYEPFSKDYFTDGRFAFIEPFEKGLQSYRAGRFEEAMTFFEQTLTIKPGDNPSLLYIERCKTMSAAPLPEDWDGVCTMVNK
jgi:adenylate cyclase